MELFSEQNIEITEMLNQKKIDNPKTLQEIKSFSDDVKNSQDIANISDLIYLDENGKKNLRTIKRKDQLVVDFGEVISGAKKELWKLSGININNLNDFSESEKEKYVEKKNILRLDAKYLMSNFNVPQDVAIAAEIIDSKIPSKPNFAPHQRANVSSLNKAYEQYVSMLKDIESFIIKSKSVDELKKGLNDYFKTKYFIKDQNMLIRISNSINYLKKEYPDNDSFKKEAINLFNSRFPNYKDMIKTDFNSPTEFINNLRDTFKIGVAAMISNKYFIDLSLKDIDLLKINSRKEINYPNHSKNDPNIWKKDFFLYQYNKNYSNPDLSTWALAKINKNNTILTKFRDLTQEDAIIKAQEYYNENFVKSKEKIIKEKEDYYNVPERETFEPTPLANSYTEEQLMNTFKIRGGQFGNYQNNRQIILDNTYFAFDTLSKILNVNQEFIGLGNQLGIAFGARGTSKSMAHYESMEKVINLTKFKGAGSLAHEWGHAFDHMLGESMYPPEKQFISSNGKFLSETNYTETIDPLKQKIFRKVQDVVQSLMSKPNGEKTDFYKDAEFFDTMKTKKYWSSRKELFARAFETFVSDKMSELPKSDNSFYLVNSITSKDYEGKSPYPKGEERELINKKFESLLDVVRESQDFVFKELEEEQNKRKANKIKHKVKEKDIEILM